MAEEEKSEILNATIKNFNGAIDVVGQYAVGRYGDDWMAVFSTPEFLAPNEKRIVIGVSSEKTALKALAEHEFGIVFLDLQKHSTK